MPDDPPATLDALDWILIAAYGVGMIAVGWFYSRRTRTTEEYLLGGRSMWSWAVGLSLFASLLSTITYLAVPGELVRFGPMILALLVALPLNFLIVGYLLIPYIRRHEVTSAYEILEQRLGLSTRLFGSALFLLLRVMWMAMIVYLTTDKILVPMLGWPAIWTPVLCAILGLLTVVYTSMGGLRAVVVTDVVQSVILFGGALLVLVLISIALGGVSAWWPDGWEPHWGEPVWGFDTTARLSFCGLIVNDVLWYTCTAGSDQIAIQRYQATPSVKTARRTLAYALVSAGLVVGVLGLVGLALMGYFDANPPPGELGAFRTDEHAADGLFPHFIMSRLPMGIGGLVIAGLLAAAMSSLSSGINSACSVITLDWIDRFRSKPMTERTHVRLARWVAAVVGTVVVAMSFFIPWVPGNIIEVGFKVPNLFVAALFVLFFMALFIRWATRVGTWAGGLAAMSVAVLIAYWDVFVDVPGIGTLMVQLGRLAGFDGAPSLVWILPGSLVAGVVVGVLASLVPVGPAAKPLKR